ncbi:uncharacterized protein V1518DRAFT_419937 [Limtongia smithiae]|uniref:uncharacterized protein n=1 Tax=Limtongia smithiae TaxID=1125753 RepID=UPI0034CDD21C
MAQSGESSLNTVEVLNSRSYIDLTDGVDHGTHNEPPPPGSDDFRSIHHRMRRQEIIDVDSLPDRTPRLDNLLNPDTSTDDITVTASRPLSRPVTEFTRPLVFPDGVNGGSHFHRQLPTLEIDLDYYNMTFRFSNSTRASANENSHAFQFTTGRGGSERPFTAPPGSYATGPFMGPTSSAPSSNPTTSAVNAGETGHRPVTRYGQNTYPGYHAMHVGGGFGTNMRRRLGLFQYGNRTAATYGVDGVAEVNGQQRRREAEVFLGGPPGFRRPEPNYGAYLQAGLQHGTSRDLDEFMLALEEEDLRANQAAVNLESPIKAPLPPQRGYTRMVRSGRKLICAECSNELGASRKRKTSANEPDDATDRSQDATGGNKSAFSAEPDIAKRIFMAKCGHVYCGECAERHRKQVRRGKRHSSCVCVVDGCYDNISGPRNMIELFP